MNKLIIASAGAGKTTYLVNRALELKSNVLITTFTKENTESIKSKIIKEKGYIPKHITIQTWFSFLIQHGAKPFQGSLKKELLTQDIRGLHFSSDLCGVKYKHPKYGVKILFNEKTEFMRHYFDKEMRIYSDKLSKFVYRANVATKGKVIERITQIYPNIFIDEVQDLSGHDLTILDLLFRSTANILLVGDPRQTTYSTHWEKTNMKYHYGNIDKFIEEKCRKKDNIEIDKTTLNCSHRNNEVICKFSSLLYEHLPATTTCKCPECHPVQKHEGIFVLRESEVNAYCKNIQPVLLRYNNKREVEDAELIYTLGNSKGREFNDVLIYPTDDMEQWLISRNNSIFKPTTKAKLYVAITRAKYSVAFVVTNQTYDALKKDMVIKQWQIA